MKNNDSGIKFTQFSAKAYIFVIGESYFIGKGALKLPTKSVEINLLYCMESCDLAR